MNRAIFASIALLMLAGCQRPTEETVKEEAKPEESSTTVTFEKETLQLAQLGVETAKESESSERLTVTGTLEADPSATAIITARVEGKIIRLTPGIGDTVASGSVVAIVESEKLHEAQLNHTLALKRLQAAESDLARRRKLAGLGAYGRPGVEEARKQETDAGAIQERARSEVRTAEAVLAEAKSRLISHESVIEQAKTAEVLAASQVELAEKQAARSERLLTAQLVSRQEHEGALAHVTKARAEREHALAEIRATQAKREELLASIESAKAKRDGAEKAMETSVRQLELARQALKRGEAIYKGGFLTSREVAEAEATVAQARVNAEGALDDVQLLGGQPGDNHSIPVKAPFAGRVRERKATLGQTVMAGEPILTLVNPTVLFAQLALFPADLPRVRPGQSVTLTIEGRTVSGVIERLGEAADEKTRSVKVRVRVDNRAGRLRPGLPVTAKISRASERILAVPAGAVQTVNGKKVVFVSGEKAGEFAPREVRVGTTQDGRTTILSGLKPGEKFVGKNAFLVKSQAMKSELGEE
ncbi:efflux RND transporter periplasmic adaptor subunit [Armatimonas sp.]|uniref:efflux RND transporter periplasmic adaptor subunit n=1 Tax=Armatimonas sp. TaxID=1872638 RepID=UPI00375215E8